MQSTTISPEVEFIQHRPGLYEVAWTVTGEVELALHSDGTHAIESVRIVSAVSGDLALGSRSFKEGLTALEISEIEEAIYEAAIDFACMGDDRAADFAFEEAYR